MTTKNFRVLLSQVKESKIIGFICVFWRHKHLSKVYDVIEKKIKLCCIYFGNIWLVLVSDSTYLALLLEAHSLFDTQSQGVS